MGTEGRGSEYHRKDVHKAMARTLARLTLAKSEQEKLVEALKVVWNEKQLDKRKEAKSANKELEKLEATISKLIRELVQVDLEHKQDLLDEISTIKIDIDSLHDRLAELSEDETKGLEDFLKFSLSYTQQLKSDWWKLGQESRFLCQKLLFPSGIYFDSSKKVSTPEISPIYRLKPLKNGLLKNQISHLVDLTGSAPLV